MNISIFAHNGVHHATDTEAITHDANDSTMWIIAGSVIMAALVYVAIRFLNRRQPQEQDTTQEDQEL